MRKCLFSAAVAILLSAGAAHADLIVTGGSSIDTWKTEPGQSMPTGTAGFVDGSLVAGVAGLYNFMYGAGLLAGETGHGNAQNINEFWVGSSEAAAEAAGQVFCTQPGDASCGGVATPLGQSFTLYLPAGAIPFGFTFGSTNQHVLQNGGTSSFGAYLAQIGLGTTYSHGPGTVAYLGLADLPYPGDNDFQDLVVRVTAVPGVPEPALLPVLAATLGAMAFYARRRRNQSA